jgi:hypothetical protein
MSIKNLYPKARPQSIYNVINGRPELPASSTFSRTSIGTYVDSSGLIKTAPAGEPRFNYDSKTGEFLGLLLEDENTNSLSYSNKYQCFSTNLVMDPPPVDNVTISPDGTQNACQLPISPTSNISQKDYNNLDGYGVVSFFVKKGSDPGSLPYVRGMIGNSQESKGEIIFNTDTLETYEDYKYIEYANGWFRLWKVLRGDNTKGPFIFRFEATNSIFNYPGFDGGHIWGCQLERYGNVLPSEPSSYIKTDTSASVTRNADAFSLTSSSNFDRGFSLLLDSDTTTDDYFYKIKASGTTIAELNNASGTLDWVINGESAATNGEYPQVGAIQPGRVRTVSSFGAADGTTQQNYLYTEGLSFPTNAIVASGADEVEFGPGQTLKAVYLWNGQLSNTEAVSVIKGEYNIVPNEPIKADSYSFVYNTDPTTIGETTITLPYIVPTVSMRVYWGDGTNSAYEQGVTPSHTYPYPGQYRIQIEADDGFDNVRLGDVRNTVQRVDQWAPQHRVGAAGDGFTGNEMNNLLSGQIPLTGIVPDFKYTNLTGLYYTFNQVGANSVGVEGGPNWSFVPTDIPLVQTLYNTFNNLNRYSGRDRTNFPTLTTGPALTDVTFAYTYAGITNFVNDTPFTDSSSITTWRSAFQGCALTQINVDTTAATNLASAFLGNQFVTSPSIVTSNCLDLGGVMSNNTPLVTQLPWDTSSATSFSSAWKNCPNLTNFPLLNTSSGTNFSNAWNGCTNLTSFPLINTSEALNLSYAWNNCPGLTAFPGIVTSKVTNISYAWTGFLGSTFPILDLNKVSTAGAAWKLCINLTAFPAITFNAGTSFFRTWESCSSLATFPANMFDTTGTLSSSAFNYCWSNCALTAQSIENILVSLDTNGQSNIELAIDGGTNAGQSTWTAAANTAYTNLINKGWTITFNP